MEKSKYAGVVVDQIHPSLDKIFHYEIPDHLYSYIQPGVRVQVPFGSRSLQGYVLSLEDKIDFPEEKLNLLKSA